MKFPQWRSLTRGLTFQRDVTELRDLLVRYLREETLDPFKSIGRYLAFGMLGSLFVGFGAFLLLLGVLRYLQWQFPFLDGSESWLPYVIVAVLALGGIGLTVSRIAASVGRPRREQP